MTQGITHVRVRPLNPSIVTGPEAGEGFTRGAYCLGKVVWGKGWEELLTLLAAHMKAHPDKPLQVDGYGEGEALNAVRPSPGLSLMCVWAGQWPCMALPILQLPSFVSRPGVDCLIGVRRVAMIARLLYRLQIRKKAQKQGLDLKFHSRRDHLDPCLKYYKVWP